MLESREKDAEKEVSAAAQVGLEDSGVTASPDAEMVVTLVAGNDGTTVPSNLSSDDLAIESEPLPVSEDAAAVSLPVPSSDSQAHAKFKRADLSAYKADPEAFYEFSYRSVVDQMVAAVVASEAPVRDDVLAQRIARAHGWLRTGSRIREKIERHLGTFDITEDSAGRFIWPKGAVTRVVDYRPADTETDRRPVTDISLPELVGFVRQYPLALDEPDPALVLARLLGLERLALSSRNRLDEAIAESAGVE